MSFASAQPAKGWRQTSTRVAWPTDARGFDNAQSRPSSAQIMRSASRVRAAGAVKSNVKRGTRDLATSPIKGPSPRPSPLQARYLSCDVSTSPGRPAYHEPASPHPRTSPSVKSSPVYGSMLRASQMEPTSARQSIVSPGSPTGKLVRTRKHNEALQAELHRLQDAFEDIDDRNQALMKEKEDVSQRLSEVQEKLHQETEGYFEQSAYAKSMALQLQEEQQKVLRLRRAVDNMELDVCQPAWNVCVCARPSLVSSVNSSTVRAPCIHPLRVWALALVHGPASDRNHVLTCTGSRPAVGERLSNFEPGRDDSSTRARKLHDQDKARPSRGRNCR